MSKIKVFFVLISILVFFSAPIAADVNNVNEPNYADWSKSDAQYKTLKDDGSVAGKLLASIIVIILLGSAAYYMTKKLGPKIGSSGGGKIRLIETANLGSGRQLHWIEAGGKRLLIGSTSQQITKICEFENKMGRDR